MNLTYTNGTPAQHDLFDAAVDLALYPWDRLDMDVAVSFSDNPTTDMSNEMAYTTINAPLDGCGRPNSATIAVLNNLETIVPGNPYRGPLVFNDVVIHELGHVVSSQLLEPQRVIVCQLFGGSPDQWTSDTAPWGTMIKEGFAETFKDIYVPRGSRQFDNRTNWKISRGNYDALLDIIDTLCPCNTVTVT